MTDDERRVWLADLRKSVKKLEMLPHPSMGFGANDSVVLQFEGRTFYALLSVLAQVRKLLAVLAEAEEKP